MKIHQIFYFHLEVAMWFLIIIAIIYIVIKILDNAEKTNKKTNKKTDRPISLNKQHFDSRGFDNNGIHKLTGTKYDPTGKDKFGNYKSETKKINTDQNERTYDKNGFDEYGIHKGTGTKNNPKGYDKNGI
jgi:hypothetical protein